jgi:hypothetical protein
MINKTPGMKTVQEPSAGYNESAVMIYQSVPGEHAGGCNSEKKTGVLPGDTAPVSISTGLSPLKPSASMASHKA